MWKLVYGSVRGTSHAVSGKPCQDYCAGTPLGQTLAAGVSDGAGRAELPPFRAPRAVAGVFCVRLRLCCEGAGGVWALWRYGIRVSWVLWYFPLWCVPSAGSPNASFRCITVHSKKLTSQARPAPQKKWWPEPESGPFRNLSSTASGCNPTAWAKAFSMRRCPNAWVLKSLRSTRTSPSVP